MQILKKLNIFLTIVIFALMVNPIQSEAATYDFYVDYENGTLTSSGSIQNPFKTIEQAKTAVRKINGTMNSDINVYLRGGNHFVEDTISFTPEDSGNNGFYVNYKAYPGETPVLNGAKRITDWTLCDSEKNIYKAPANGCVTRQLYINDVRAVRARGNEKLINATKNEDGYISDDLFLADYKKPDDLEFVYQAIWTNARCGVSDIQKTSDGKVKILMDQPGYGYITSTVRGSQVVSTFPIYYENAYELLSDEGEFYLDKSEDVFYYIPRENEDMKTAEVFAPAIEKMITLTGKNPDEKIHNINFDGVAFKYTTWNRPSTKSGHSDTQCNYMLDPEGSYHRMIDATISVYLGEHINFSNCTISKCGSIGIKVEYGSQYCDIIGNHIYDLSGTGIAVGEVEGAAATTKDPRLFCRGNDVKNNLVENIGIDYMSSVAISAGFPMESEISHNEINNTPYSGMHIGYGWATNQNTGSNLRDFKVCNNLIKNTMMSLNDGGGIYVLGATGGTKNHRNIVSGNYILNSKSPNGILYADEGSNFWDFNNNVVDNYEYKSGRWILIWKDTIHYVDLKNNYTNIRSMTNDGSNCIEEDTYYNDDGKWPDKALEIINNAGLEEEYAGKLKGINKDELEKIIASFPKNMKLNEKIALEYSLKATGGYDIDKDKCTVALESSDNNIVSVSDDNFLNAVGSGKCEITLSATKDGIIKTAKAEITVDDILSELLIEPSNNVVLVGQTKKLTVKGRTKFENDIETLEDIKFDVSDSNIAKVTSDGNLTALGEGNFDLIVTAMSDNVSVIKKFPYLSVLPGNSAELDGYEKYKFYDETKNAALWSRNDGKAVVDTKGIELAGTFDTYNARQFNNQLLEFNMTLNGAIAWPTLSLCNKSDSICALYPNTSAYIIVIKAKEIELQKWINGKGVMIFGEAPGRITIEKERIKNEIINADQQCFVQVGTFDEAAGVHIILWVNSQKVIDYIDTADDAIRGGGYFGVIEQSVNRTMHIAPPSEIVSSKNEKEEYFWDIKGHWCEEDINEMYEEKIVEGKEDKRFMPDDYITRAEFITLVSRVLGLKAENNNVYFSDCKADDWYNPFINSALDNNLFDINMIKDSAILPNTYITREEMSSIIARACMKKMQKTNIESAYFDGFEDKDSISLWAKDYFGICIGLGIINGQTKTILSPNGYLTRAESIKVIKKLSDL